MKDEKNEVFRGHLSECVDNLASRMAGLDGAEKRPIQNFIAEFCGVQQSTASLWLTDLNTSPTGMRLLKLYCCLEVFGYRVIEQERRQKTIRHFVDLLGFGLLTADEATSLLGYTKPSILFDVLFQKQGISKNRLQIMWDTWKARKEEIEAKKVETRGRLPKIPETRQPVSNADKPAQARLPIESVPIVHFMRGLLALLEDRPNPSLREDEVGVVLRLSAVFRSWTAQISSSTPQEDQ